MSDITKSLQIPFHFDKVKLVNEMTIISQEKWIPHFNTGGYNGNWDAIPLYAPGGNPSILLRYITVTK